MHHGLVDEPEPTPHHKKKNSKNYLVVQYDEDARREYLTGFRKRKQERRRIAKEAITEKDRIARREAKKQRKLEMLRAYGIDVQEHVVPAAADDLDKEATYDAADTAITVKSSTLVTKKPLVSSENASDSEDNEEVEEEEEEEEKNEENVKRQRADSHEGSQRPKHWKQVRTERHGPKKKSWSKSKAKKIKKQHKREAKKRHRN